MATQSTSYNEASKFVRLTSSQRQHINHIKEELSKRYQHLNPTFYEDSICMQAKIDINVPKGQSLLKDPGHFADVLKAEHFVPEALKHHRQKLTSNHDYQQYILTSDTLKSIGHKFVLKATFGPSFISLWFRNESTSADLELPLCYAFEIINKLHDRVTSLSSHQSNNKLRAISLAEQRKQKAG